MIEAMKSLWGNMRQEESAHKPPTLVHPSTSKRSIDTSTLTQSMYEIRKMTVETQAKRTGKAPKTPTFTRTPTTEETIDYAPNEATKDYKMNGIPHNYEAFPEFRDDPDDNDPQL